MRKILEYLKVKTDGSFMGIPHFRAAITIVICFFMVMEYSSWRKRVKFSDTKNIRITLAKCTDYNFHHMKYSYSGVYYVNGVKHHFDGFRTKAVAPDEFVDRYFWVKFHVDEPEICKPWGEKCYIILGDSIPIDPKGITESEYLNLRDSHYHEWKTYPYLK